MSNQKTKPFLCLATAAAELTAAASWNIHAESRISQIRRW